MQTKSVNDKQKSTWKAWVFTIWAILAVLGLLVGLGNIPGENRIIYLLKLSHANFIFNPTNVTPGQIIKINGTAETEAPFLSAWDHRPAIYERQVLIRYFRGRRVRDVVLLDQAIPFRVKLAGGETIRVVPSVKKGDRDLFEAKVTGKKNHMTDWSIRTGDSVIVYGPVRKIDGEMTVAGSFGKRLIVSNLSPQKLEPLRRFDFWLYALAWFFFVSGSIVLGIAIYRYKRHPRNL